MRLPLAFNLQDKNIVVVGAGHVATRRVQFLLQFGAQIKVIAPLISAEILGNTGLKISQKRVEMADLDHADFVIALTNNVDLNYYILKYCKEKRIHVQAAGWVKESDFSFPAFWQDSENYVGVFSHDFNPHSSIAFRNKLSFILSQVDIGAQVVLAGFGPGHPNLMTIKTWSCLFWADIIYYDDLIDEGVLSLVHCEKIYVGKRKGLHHLTQDEINAKLLDSAQKGSKVLRLKGGDPFIFGRGGEELLYLRAHQIKVEVLPGVSSSLAASASSQIPLTMRKIAKEVTFLSGHHTDVESRIYPTRGTLVLYMAATKLDSLAQDLIRSGWSKEQKVALIQNASLENEKIEICSIEIMEKTSLGSPLSVIIGQVVEDFAKTDFDC